MNTRKQFKRKVIEAIHGLPYEDAMVNEIDDLIIAGQSVERLKERLEKDPCRQITIGRVMKALMQKNRGNFYNYWEDTNYLVIVCQFIDHDEVELRWKLTKENGQECTDDDQTEETLKKLLQFLTTQ